jgi:hypothetical protein
VVIQNTTFDGCSSSNSGGALFIQSDSLQPMISGCFFLNCSVTGGSIKGGGLSIVAGDTIILSCTFSGCRSADSCSSGRVQTSQGSSLTCSELTITDASANVGDNWLMWGESSSPKCQFDHGNVTACETVGWGCGITFNSGGNIALEFSEFRLNGGTNCIVVMGGTVSSIRCLSVRSNRCTTPSEWNGIFGAAVSMTVSDSALTGNTYDCFLFGAGTVTFANCYLDTFTLPTTSGGGFVTTGCLTDLPNASWVAGCAMTRTTARSPTPAFSGSSTVGPSGGAGGLSPVAIAGIVLGVVVVVAVVCAVVAWRYGKLCRRKNEETWSSLERALNEAHIN